MLEDNFGVHFEFKGKDDTTGYHYLEGSDGKTRVFKGPNVVNVIDTPKPAKEPTEKFDTRTTHTVTTDDGVMQFNPDSSRYDIKVGNRPPKEFAPDRSASDTGLSKKESARMKEQVGQQYKRRLQDLEDQFTQEKISFERLQTLKQQAQDDYEQQLESMGQQAQHVEYPKAAPAPSASTAPKTGTPDLKSQAIEELKKRGYNVK